MPRYKLRVPQTGDMLYGDDVAIVADTISEAREFWEDEEGESVVFLHSMIGRCQLLYKRDIDNGDGHDGAEPGDTTVNYCPDDGRDLRPDECRLWMLGAPSFRWNYEYLPDTPIDWRTIPAGVTVHHPVLGSGRTVAKPWRWRGQAVVDVRFAWPDYKSGVRRLLVAQAHFMPSPHWPSNRRRVNLTVVGEVVAENVSEEVAETLRDLRCDRLRAEWEAEQVAVYEMVLA